MIISGFRTRWGEFTCDDKAEDKFLLLAAGCGVTPIMSMRRWLAKNRPQADVRVIYNVRTPQDVIFADEWRNYPVTLVAENNVTEGFIAGRLTRELLAGVPDLASRTVMTCGPAPYMDWVEQEVKALGVTRFFKEKFFTPVAEAATSGLKFTKLQPAREFYAPVGTTLLEALESNNVPVVAACRAGVCGCCKTKVVSGEYTVSSTMTLTDAEIAEGYVLACSCHPQGGFGSRIIALCPMIFLSSGYLTVSASFLSHPFPPPSDELNLLPLSHSGDGEP